MIYNLSHYTTDFIPCHQPSGCKGLGLRNCNRWNPTPFSETSSTGKVQERATPQYKPVFPCFSSIHPVGNFFDSRFSHVLTWVDSLGPSLHASHVRESYEATLQQPRTVPRVRYGGCIVTCVMWICLCDILP